MHLLVNLKGSQTFKSRDGRAAAHSLPVPASQLDKVAVKVQAGDRQTLRERRRQPPRPLIFISDTVMAKAQAGDRFALSSHGGSGLLMVE